MPKRASTSRFVELISESEIRLDRAALEIALCCRPDEVNVAASLALLDEFALQVEAYLGTGQAGLSKDASHTKPDLGSPTAKSVTDTLYRELGFGGDRADYYQPDNSYLDRVLVKRSGIPITLAVVVIEVARRMGIRLDPVGMPGHFLVGVPTTERTQPQFFDPFDGVYLDYDGAKTLFQRPRHEAPFSDEFLKPIPPAMVLRRILNNLRLNYLHQSQPTSLRDVNALAVILELIVCLPDCSPTDYLQLADVLTHLGDLDVAVKHLEAGAQRSKGSDAEALLAAAKRLLARLN